MSNNEINGDIIALIKSAITGDPATLSDSFDFTDAYKIAKRHGIISMVFYGLENSRVALPEAINNHFFNETIRHIAQSETQLAEVETISRTFSAHGISHMPLKGAILKYLYKKPDMRSMADVDILIHRSDIDLIDTLMKELGYEKVDESNHEYIYFKHPFMNVELHKMLIPSYNKDYYRYYGDGWNKAKQSADDPYSYVLSPEDNFLYIFTHFAKHYRDSGIGCKHVADLWVYLSHFKNSLDHQYIRQELNKLCLESFYDNILQLINVWFEGAKHSDLTRQATLFIFNSGQFGSYENQNHSSLIKESQSKPMQIARVTRYIKNIFPPHSTMRKLYPVLVKFPFLLPLFWIVRGVERIFKNPQRIKEKHKMLTQHDNESHNLYKDHFDLIQLHFNFKE